MKALPLILGLIACNALAGPIYKYTDKQGNIVYSDNQPESGDATAIEITPAQNTYQSDNSNQQAHDQILLQQQLESAQEQSKRGKKQNQKESLRQAVKHAEKDLKNAKVIREGDMFPVPSGGIRYSDQYKQRVQAAEAALENAKKAYQKAL